MFNSSNKPNLLGKQNREEDSKSCPILKKHKEDKTHKENSDDKLPKKTLYVSYLSPQTDIPDIISFFKDVGEVVRIQLLIDPACQHTGCGFVEFASSKEAKNALEKKKGEYLDDCQILVDVPHLKATPFPPTYCMDHKVWYEKPHQLERLPHPIEENEPFEDVIFIANLSPNTTKIFQIINFFKDVGDVRIRLIVNHEGKHVGCGFVQFPFGIEAKTALETKNGEFLDDHKIMLIRVPLKTPHYVEVDEVRNKTLFIDDLSTQTKISHIINFFKDVGEVVHIRLIVDRKGRLVGCGFVEFASANEANKALEKKKGEKLMDSNIFLDAVNTNHYRPGPKHCIDYNVRYEDYIRQESLPIEGVDETSDFIEEVAAREKTLFFSNKWENFSRISRIEYFFRGVGQVVRVRLIVDHCGEYVGCGFVEFASAEEAKKALEEKDDDRRIILKMAEMAPYPFRPKYNLGVLAEKLRYKDYILQKSLSMRSLRSESFFL